jgi:hypothetical protein
MRRTEELQDFDHGPRNSESEFLSKPTRGMPPQPAILTNLSDDGSYIDTPASSESFLPDDVPD